MPRALSQPAENALWAIATIDARSNPPDFVVLRVASIVESYVDTLLERLTTDHLRGNSAFEVAIERLARERIHQNWPTRREWLRESFGVSIDGQPVDQDFSLLVKLRNAVAHGTGSLTRLQRGKLSEQLELERQFSQRLSVQVNGYRFATTSATATKVMSVGSEFISALDATGTAALERRGLI